MTESAGGPARDPATDLERIAYLLEQAREAAYRVRAFRRAARTVRETSAERLAELATHARLTELPNVGDVTARCVTESLAGVEPVYLRRVAETAEALAEEWRSDPEIGPGLALRALLRGDLHSHSDWSDGGTPIVDMARAAVELGHEYLALTDHSPRLTVANGLSAARLREQLDVIAALNVELAPLRILTGIEVDILEDGSLDQDADLLAELDVVVASVHSKLRAPSSRMTPRMIAAVADPNVDVLGHCTGRLVVGRSRPESEFDHAAVFEACQEHGVAVEINSRPERLDPPKRLLRLAVETGCLFAVDTDAHAPGQLEWQLNGCARAARCGVDPARIVNTWPLVDLRRWTSDHAAIPRAG